MANSEVITFRDAVSRIGISTDGLRVEGFRTDGTSNYLANLNYNGQTWAAALRMPARGAKVQEFLVEKQAALRAVQYLVDVLKGGKNVGNSCTLKFDGISFLVDGGGVQDFLRAQGMAAPLALIDRVRNREKRIVGFEYPQNLDVDVRSYIEGYPDCFYLSRGAPAWETLEEYTELEEPVAHALAKLHQLTGSGNPLPFTTAVSVLDEVESDIRQNAEKWTPVLDSKESRALEKSMKKWKADGNPERIAIIRCERFLRTSAGKKIYSDAFYRSISRRGSIPSPLKCFVHGDCHGGNFILVKYMYEIDHPGIILDRVFLNEIFEGDKAISRIAIKIDADSEKILHDLPERMNDVSLIASRKRHFDIHLIDLDNGRGIDHDSKEVHLYDAISYAISVSNLSRLFASPISSKDILRQYYNGLGA